MEGRHPGTARHIGGLWVSGLWGMDSAFCGENGLGCWRLFLLVRFLLHTQKKMNMDLAPQNPI